MFQLVQLSRVPLIFTLCCVWITAISAHDAVLVILHREVISQFEQNPLGRWLITLQGGDVWLFVMVKFAGAAAVCTVLVRLYRYRSDIALVVAVALSCFQLLLLFYLHCR